MSSNTHQPTFDSRLEKMDVQSAISCHVCGNQGGQKHFGAICCAPCKMFFRRNVQNNLETRPCPLSGSCGVPDSPRSICRICRFKKCLTVGMQKELLRASRMPRHCCPIQQPSTRPQPITGEPNSSATNHSLLTMNEWNILSSVVHAFDKTSPTSRILNLINSQSSYPLKLRMKSTAEHLLNTLNSVFRALRPFVENLPQFSALQTHDKTELLNRHLRTVGGFGGIWSLREANIYSSPIYTNSLSIHYGSDLCRENLRIAHRYELDGTVSKLFLAALIFSTCTDVVQPHNHCTTENLFTDRTRLLSNPKQIIEIQNIYVETVFKYMLYRFGSRDATLRFAAITKNFLDYALCLIQVGEYYQTQNEIIERIRSEIIDSSAINQ